MITIYRRESIGKNENEPERGRFVGANESNVKGVGGRFAAGEGGGRGGEKDYEQEGLEKWSDGVKKRK